MKRLLPALLFLGLLALGQSPGAKLYSANCQSCHQATGQGIPGAFPPLTHLDQVVQAKGGREYLIRVVLYGLQGPLTVQGKTYNGVMPPFRQLKDQEVADLLNYVLATFAKSKAKPISAEEVKAQRARALSPQEVLKSRPPVK
ncbi:c-type cytochrome [Thermus scotoductus]|uniref:Cytochrome C biogenesis protein CcsB n=1 Tax=Thermus scotoductus TaxID=37636 RepID=A0A430RA38_THESC|nr:cytochrome c [Thermus scotoductus]RTG95689.1 cytochrome C biogenesis protein CcsB [Thermus scotoductus]RTH04237.1 cytochrome C biogenesis protein CcsB [Thermus scotoductus]RTH23447.1 cytochrome C biogenesis protein CcsB [Thermus scotoductus]RTI01539.1 cytochrome C biogenesis protein CcsB [Thermus scotoductus]RTI22997.1 cytochrome C biogenesis protein CcsB [Thermus scotoductus]